MCFSFSLFTIIDSKCLFVSKGNIMFQIQLEVAPEKCKFKSEIQSTFTTRHWQNQEKSHQSE